MDEVMTTLPHIENYSAIIGVLHGMEAGEAKAWVEKPEFGYTPEQQLQLLQGRAMARS